MPNADLPVRRLLRLQSHDYAAPATYLVTICTFRRARLFGRIVEGQRVLNRLGRIVLRHWHTIGLLHRDIIVDAFEILPDHLHGILRFTSGQREIDREAHERSTLRPGSLGATIGQFKSTVTKASTAAGVAPSHPIWQKNYHERIIRDNEALEAARAYVLSNALRWRR